MLIFYFQHVKNLRDLCKDCLPDVVNASLEIENKRNKEKLEVTKSFETMELPEGDYQDVYVSAVEDPGMFYVQLLQSVGEYVSRSSIFNRERMYEINPSPCTARCTG